MPLMRHPKLAVFLAVICLVAPHARAESKKKRIWQISAAVLGAVTIADVHSSLGRHELNPMLRSSNGRFGARGIAVKSAIVGGALGAQWLLLRKNPKASGYAAGANFAMAAATSAAVARNHSVR